MPPRPPPKISLRHDHDWTRGKAPLGSTVDQQPEGTVTRRSSTRNVIDQGNLITRKMCLLLKVKRPVPMRSMKKVFTENSVLQIDQGNLISRLAWLKLTICLKTSELSKLTMDQGNLMSVTAQVHTRWRTTCSWSTSWSCVTQHGQRVQSWN